jgi:hypothetical protein
MVAAKCDRQFLSRSPLARDCLYSKSNLICRRSELFATQSEVILSNSSLALGRFRIYGGLALRREASKGFLVAPLTFL